jgi:DNA polymerase-3 subunit alpha
MAAKGAIRDVGRVMDFGYNFCDGVSKLIPFKPGKPVSIAEAIEEEPMLKERQQNEEEVKRCWTWRSRSKASPVTSACTPVAC